MDFFAVFYAILILFAIIALGFIAKTYTILDGRGVHWISHILVNVALPALTISSMQVPLTAQTAGIVEITLLISVAYYCAVFGLSLLVCRFLPATGSEKGVFQFMLIFPNVAFIGIPVAGVILGPGSLFYVVLFNLPFYFLVFTMGVYLLARGKPGTIDPKTLLTPGLIASFIGLFLFLAGFMLPSPIETALDWIGKATTPLAMLVVGALLASLPVSRLAGDWRIAIVTGFRLLILPILAFFILSPFLEDRLLLGTVVLLIAMPVAANTVLLSEEYRVDATLASQGVFLSTLLCLLTIPVIAILLGSS